MVRFSFAGGEPIPARVARHGWLAGAQGDLALLELDRDAPSSAQPAPLLSPRSVAGHACTAYGYPVGHDGGVVSELVVTGQTPDRLQLMTRVAHGHQIVKGFSGTGLLDTETGTVVGLVVTRDLDRNVLGGFAIPLQVVAAALPQLSPWLGWRVGTDRFLYQHWRPRARGVYQDTTPGWYFTGRDALLQELAGWMERGAPEAAVRVLTGAAGTGKSAVLAWLCMLSDPQLRAEIAATRPAAVADAAAVLAAGRVSAGLWARDLDANQTADALASALSLPVPAGAPVADVLSALEGLDPAERACLVVVLDALDEAREPQAIVRSLLLPLARDLGVKVLTGTRSGRDDELLSAFGGAAVVYRLDDPAWFDRQDLADYAAACLRADFGAGLGSGYRTESIACRQVSEAIARAAGSNFLVAGLAARARASEPVIDVSVPGWRDRQRFPAEVGQAFDDYLSRFGTDESRARDLLRAVAYAEGPGLTADELWADMASALAAPSRYSGSDLAWLLDSAAGYLMESGAEQDQPVYRIFHQALAEHLRPEAKERRVQRQLVKVLIGTVPVAADGRREWLAAMSYVRTHLATHAGKGQVLDQLVNDPEFLLAADPTRVLPALGSVTDPEARRSASAFESAQYLLRGWPLGQATAQLDLAARVHGATALVDAISQLPFERPWRICWGHWARPDRNILLGQHEDEVRCVAIAMADGAPVAVSSGDDGTVRVWDLRTGTARATPQSGHTGSVKALAAGDIDGVPVAVSGGSDGVVRVWDLRTGTARGQLTGHGSDVTAVAVGAIDGVPAAVSGGGDGTVRVWDLRTETARGEPLTGHTRPVKALALGEVDGCPVAVSGGGDGLVRVWDLRAGTARGESFTAHSPDVGGLPMEQVAKMPELVAMAGVTALAIGELDGCPVAVSGGGDGLVRVWDLRAGTKRGEPLTGHTYDVAAVTVGELDGTPVAVTSDGVDGTVRIWDLRAGRARGGPLTASWGDVAALAVGEVDGVPVAVSSGGLKATVHVWDLRAWTTLGKPLIGHSRPVTTLAVGDVDGVPVAISGSIDGTVRMWDLRAEAAGEPVTGNSVGIRALSAAVGEVDGVPVAICGGSDGTVQVWDLRTGRPRGKPMPGHEASVYAVAAAKIDGAPIAVSGGSDGTVRVWDLRTETARGEPLTGHQAWVLAVAVAEVDGTPIAVSGGWDGTVRMWDLRTGRARGRPLSANQNGVGAVAVGEIDGTPIAVSGGGDGTVQVWDLQTGTARGTPLPGHTAPVGAVAIGQVDRDPVAVSGGWDGSVRVWDLRAGEAHREILPGHTRSVRAVALKVDGSPVVASGDDNGVVSLCALDRGQSAAVSFNFHAGVEAIAACDAAGWLTVTKDGSLFLWRMDLTPWRATDANQVNSGSVRVAPLRAIRVLGEAERVAQSITDAIGKAPELARIAEALAVSDPDRAARLFTVAEQAADSITSEEWKALTLAEVAKALTSSDPHRAVGLAQSITGKKKRASALVQVAEVLAALDPDRAAGLITDAERLAQSITAEGERASALAEVARVLAVLDRDRAAGLITGAERLAQSITVERERAPALAKVATVLAVSHPDRAAGLAQSITGKIPKVSALTQVANALAASDPDRAARLIADAEHVAESITAEGERARAVAAVAATLAASDPEKAISLAQSITDEFWNALALTGIVEALAASHPNRALQVAQSITEQWRTRALAGIAARWPLRTQTELYGSRSRSQARCGRHGHCCVSRRLGFKASKSSGSVPRRLRSPNSSLRVNGQVDFLMATDTYVT